MACALRFAQHNVESKLTATELATTAIGSCDDERANMIRTGRFIATLGYPGGSEQMLCRNEGRCLSLAQAAHEADFAAVRAKVMELIALQTSPAQ